MKKVFVLIICLTATFFIVQCQCAISAPSSPNHISSVGGSGSSHGRHSPSRSGSPKASSPKASSPKASSPKASSPKADSPRAGSPKRLPSGGAVHQNDPQDDRTIPKQHAVIVRSGKRGPEVLMIGSQKNPEKPLGFVRGKAHKQELPIGTVQREMKEEAGHKFDDAHGIHGPFKTGDDKNVQGYLVHLKKGAKQGELTEPRDVQWVHHSKVDQHLTNKPEMRRLYHSMKPQIETVTQPKDLRKSESMPPVRYGQRGGP